MRLEDILLRGTRTAQPAFGAVPTGTLYFVTDEGKLERSSGAAWQTYSATGAETDPVFLASESFLFAAGDKAKLNGIAAGATVYTDELAQDAIGAMADAQSLVYTDATPLLAVKTQLSITKDAGGLKLSGDSATPGNTKLYGTDGSGNKGWYDQPAGGGTIEVFRNRTILTDAQIKSLSTIPIQLIAAPGAGKFLNVIACITMKQSTAGVYSATPNFSLRWDTLTDDITTATGLFLATANKRWQRCGVVALGNTTDPINKAIVAKLAADVTGGNAANYILVDTIYEIVTDGP